MEKHEKARIIDGQYKIVHAIKKGGFGIIYFSFDLTLARKFDVSSRWRKSGFFGAFLGVLYFCCDAIENIFIFAMLTDPLGFPDIWAVTHSWIALIKFIFNFSSGFWVIAACIFLISRRKTSK